MIIHGHPLSFMVIDDRGHGYFKYYEIVLYE